MSSESIRVGDRERADAAARLSAHAAAGRLSVEELEERLERAGRAVVASDLRALEADLPAPAAPERRPPGWSPPFVAVALACVAATVLASLAVGHPFPPFLLVALLLWRVGWRPYRFAPRRLR